MTGSLQGITELGHSERTSRMHHIAGSNLAVVEPVGITSATKSFLVWSGVLLVMVLLVWLITTLSGRKQGGSPDPSSVKPGIFGQDSVAFPGGLFFDKSHTWTFMEKEGNVRIGIDDFIQHVTGPVTRVVMKEQGEKITRGEPFLTLVQYGKQLEIKSPLSGTVMERNKELLKDASLLNSEPYANGWICMVKPVNWLPELKSFFMGEPYREWIQTEFARLKDFLSSGLRLKDDRELSVVLQDGGEIRDGALEEFGPEVWEEFQTRFINRS